MMSTLSRRTFIHAGSVAAVSVLSGCTLNLQRVEYLESYVDPPEEGLPGEDLWYATGCRQCAAGCGMIVRVSNGRARKVEGNPYHPVNQGKLCARGQAVLQELYDPDRLTGAVKQTGGRGSLVFEPALWDNALYEVTDALRSAIQRDPAGVALLLGNSSSHLAVIAQRFTDSIGAPDPIFYSLSDELDGLAVLSQSSGELLGSPLAPVYDIGQADVVFSFGASLLETWLSPVSQSRRYARMRQQDLGKRSYLVQFESRFSSTAASADEWVAVQPGTEGLVALALGKLISERTGSGLGTYGNISVGEMAEASGVDSDRLNRLADLFSRFERPVAIAGNRLASQRNASMAMRAVHGLNLVMGRLGQPGGVYLPSAPLDVAPPSSYADVSRLIERMAGGEIDILLIHGANPVFELPQGSGFVEALDNVKLVICFNSSVDETAAQADLVLPDHTNLEGWGYHVALGGDRPAVTSQQPVVRPLYDTRSTVDVFLALAQRPGIGAALPWSNEVEFLQDAVGKLGPSWVEWRRLGGWWADAPALVAPQVGGLGSLSPQLPVFEGASDQYGYHLHIYPSIALGDGRGANKSWLQETPDPMTTVAWHTLIEINPETASELGLEDEDVVRVVSPAGEIEAVVYKYPGVARNVVAIAVGRGHENYGRFAKDVGSNPLKLIVPVTDPETGALAWGATRVRIEKTEKRKTLARLESPEGVDYLWGGGSH
jgi:anaerobic selenocysteine-containing dehydrogenase